MEKLQPREVCGFIFKTLNWTVGGDCQSPYDKDWSSVVKIPGGKPPPSPQPKVSSLINRRVRFLFTLHDHYHNSLIVMLLLSTTRGRSRNFVMGGL